jgi:hypothetical protein
MSNPLMPVNTLETVQKITEYGLIHYIVMILLSVWAATVRHITNIKNGGGGGWVGWLMEVCASAFVGLVTGLLCLHFNIELILAFVIVSVSAHTGTNMLILIKDVLIKTLKNYAGTLDDKL